MPSRVLAETPLPVPALVPETRTHHGNVRHKLLLPLAAAAAIAAALSIFIAAVIAVLLYRRCSKSRTAPEAAKASINSAGNGISVLRRFTYAQLQRATASFSLANRLGQGGFGPVFRGSLSNGQEIAVKVMDSGSLQGEREFQNELSLAKTILSQESLDKKWIVAPLGFCVAEKREGRRRWWRWRRKDSSSGEEADLDIEVDESSRRLLLVYELMQNGSLQDSLLLRRCPELDWARRFSVAIDIARGLQFLHCTCDPPVIHGDIKPSNILLDSAFSGRIADLGLSRLKTNEQQQPPTLDEYQNSTSNHQVPAALEISIREPAEDDASVMGEALAESTTTTTHLEETPAVPQVAGKSPEDDECSIRVPESSAAMEVASTSEAAGFDRISIDSGMADAAGTGKHGRRKSSALSGKDWWWRQDGNGGANSESGSVKDYVMEWIKSEIRKERPGSSEWIDDHKTKPKPVKNDRKKQQRRLEWWAALDEEKSKKEKKPRQPKEWWKEEYCDELANKHKTRVLSKSRSSIGLAGQQCWQKYDSDDDGVDGLSLRRSRKFDKTKRSRSRSSRTSIDQWTAPVRRNSRDWAGSDIPKSGAVSSTPSMRGTVCYVAPEYGGGGPLSEKCDIYSFGVLLLVLISGRRPLQMTASPMSELERANLISWARHLARSGKLLDLLDPTLVAVDKDQALLCISIALLCIQKSPSRRPSSKEIVGMLTGQMETPALPMEFSPSPPCGFSFKSRKRTAQ